MKVTRRLQDEAGIALIVVLLVALVVGAISAGAALVGTNTSLISRYSARTSTLEAVADAGLEEGRSRINGDKTLYPDSGFATLENGVTVYDADGAVVPGVQRWMYVGPSGVTSGQYGVFGSVIVVAQDNTGNRIIRREQVAQESFAKYAYFTDIEPANLSFGSGDMITGPVHTNDFLKIYSSGATFLGEVSTARTIQGVEYGTFKQGYTERAPIIPMPTTADLNKLEVQGAAGGTSFVGDLSGGPGQATTRIEFITLDINGDGQPNGTNEGFIRVFRSANAGYVAGSVPTDYTTAGLRNSKNCGYDDATGVFKSAATISAAGGNWQTALTSPTRHCYVGGSPRLFGAFNANDPNGGQYVPWTGTVDPQVTAAVVAAGGQAGDAQYFIPINRQFNPSFKGVIFVRGKVAIHGVLRGQVTVAATQDIIIVNDMTYATNPGAGLCNDILGLFAGHDVVISENTINEPTRPYATAPAYLTYDDTKDEFLHAVVLALDIFTVENWGGGPANAEACESTPWGRGCLYLTGGVIQKTRGGVAHSAGYGNLKRYSYDQCAFTNPPPYFPTTGHFGRGRYYEIDPVNFDVAAYWKALAPPSN
jgi:hypothetical protein